MALEGKNNEPDKQFHTTKQGQPKNTTVTLNVWMTSIDCDWHKFHIYRNIYRTGGTTVHIYVESDAVGLKHTVCTKYTFTRPLLPSLFILSLFHKTSNKGNIV